MKYILLLILSSIIIFLLYNNVEGFTTYQLNYRTDIEPNWPKNVQSDYKRCICSSNGECRCLTDKQIDIMWDFPDYFFN